MKIKQAFILVGGAGTRLGTLTQFTPKPLLPIANKAFIEYWFDALEKSGIVNIVLLCGYLGEQFEKKYHHISWGKAHIHCLIEKKAAGTGGALVHAMQKLENQFFVINGDSFLSVHFLQLQNQLLASPHFDAAMVVLPSPTQSNRYSTVHLDSHHQVTSFTEKKSGAYCNGGVYAFKRDALNPLSIPSSLEYDLLPQLAQKKRLTALVCQSDFIDIGIAKDYQRATPIIKKIAKTYT